MSRDPRRAPAFRCLLLWSFLTAVAVSLLLVARAELSHARQQLAVPGDPAFAPALAVGSVAALTLAVLWLWCAMTSATLEAIHGVHRVDLPGVRGAVRRLVLAGCGVALAASVAPAHADDLRGAAGQPPQPLAPVHEVAQMSTVPGAHVVEPGDSLWAISAARLGPGATAAEIDQAWRALWRANAAVVGADPDRIAPGQRLDVPEPRR